LVKDNIFAGGMKGEFFYANAGFSEVFCGLNPYRISENVFFQYIVRSSSHGWQPPFGVGIQPGIGKLA